MFIEQPPAWFRAFFPGVTWRIPTGEKVIYLTFDDGPIPQVTPWVLETLDRYDIRATFFMVGDNVRKHPDTFQAVIAAGHRAGNHTFNHLQGIHHAVTDYVANVEKGQAMVGGDLFRPPHGLLKPAQLRILREKYRVIMWDVVTRDYSRRLSPDEVLGNALRYTRDGSILVFHDSLKAERNLRYALPRALEHFLADGYTFRTL